MVTPFPIETSFTAVNHRYIERFWRVFVVALVVGALGLLSSYAFSPSYQAATGLLVRAGNTTFLSNTGGTLGAQSATIDPTVAKSIVDTESALLADDSIATEIVNQLHLAGPVNKKSLASSVKAALKDGYDYLVHGTTEHQGTEAQAVQAVQSGLAANELTDTYLISLTATGASKAQAIAIDNAAANDLVALVQRESQSSAAKNRNYLANELNQADISELSAASALANFAKAHSIAPTAFSSLFDSTVRTDLQAQLAQDEAQLQGASAQLRSDEQALAATDPTTSSLQQVDTGRSSTNVNQSAQNPSYTQLALNVHNDHALVASLSATISELSSELTLGQTGTSATASLTPTEATRVAQLEQSYTTSVDTYQQVQTNYEQAVASTATDPIELSRVDTAVGGNWPVSPKRYLFGAIGLLLGLLVGFALSARAAHRKHETLFVSYWDEPLPPRTATYSPPPAYQLAASAVVHEGGQQVTVPSSSKGSGNRSNRNGHGSLERVQAGRFEVFSRSGHGAGDSASGGSLGGNGSGNGSTGGLS